mmetsp:Transcript_9528/g.23271  ORF Transcript_9528/g.23271 Transcript_9528/m.23271 type:complete len:943 (-) Transcript_9528:46-2874(-)
MSAAKLSAMHMFRNKFSKGGNSAARGQQQQSSSSNSNSSSPPSTIDEEQEHGNGLSPSNNSKGQQQQQQQQQSGVPQPVVHSSVGRVPAPLPKARTATRSAPPSNRVASVPVPPSSSRPPGATPVMNMPSGPPPPSPLTAQQGGGGARQYGHAPHLQRGSGSQQQRQQGASRQSQGQHQQQQQHQQQSSSSGGGSNNNPQQLTDLEKKEKERFLMFTRVLMKYLEQRDVNMHAQAKAQIKECYEKNKSGDPQFRSLTTSMKARLRSTVGESYWKKAHDYLDHFLKQKKEQKEKQMQSQRGQQHPGQQQQRPGMMPGQATHGGQQAPPPIVRTSVPRPVNAQQQQQLMSQIDQAAAAAQKMPIAARSTGLPMGVAAQKQQQQQPLPVSTVPNPVPSTTGGRTLSLPGPLATTAVAAAKPALTPEELKEQKRLADNAKRRDQRNKQAREKRALKKKEKDEKTKAKTSALAAQHQQQQAKVQSVAGMAVGQQPIGVAAGIVRSGTAMVQPLAPAATSSAPAVAPGMSALSAQSSSSGMSVGSSSGAATASGIGAASTKDKPKADASKKKKKKAGTSTTGLNRSSSASSASSRKKPARESSRAMEMCDHATLIDVRTLPALFGSKEYKMDVNLDDEQRILLYGDEDKERRRKVKDIARAASEALDAGLDGAEDNIGGSTRTRKVPSAFDGWGAKNVVSARNAWARVRLPECEAQRANAPPTGTNAGEGSDAAAGPEIENDWFNEKRVEREDTTLALLSEAAEVFLKSTIEKAVGRARLRQNLDGVRLWHTLQAHSGAPNNGDGEKPTHPPALIRLGCDVRRQVALAEGNAAKVYQRMEEALSRRNDGAYANSVDDNLHDPEAMLRKATSMADLSKMPPLKSAAQNADADARQKFAVFGGVDSQEPPFGRLPKRARVTLQDIAVGAVGNRTSMIASRRKRFRVGLRY